MGERERKKKKKKRKSSETMHGGRHQEEKEDGEMPDSDTEVQVHRHQRANVSGIDDSLLNNSGRDPTIPYSPHTPGEKTLNMTGLGSTTVETVEETDSDEASNKREKKKK